MSTLPVPPFGNNDPNDPSVTFSSLDDINAANGVPLSASNASNDSNTSNADSTSLQYLLDQANQQHKSYGNTAFYLFVNSSSFQSAYKSFSKGPNPEEWIARLLSIANSLSNVTYSFWDVIREGFAGAWSKEQKNLAAAAQGQLQVLISEWQSFVNSLPAVQRQQYEDAGLNIALDGGSALTGSDIQSSNAAGFIDTNSSNQDFDNALNFATSLSGGLLDLINTVNSVFSGARERSISLEGLSKQSDTSLQSINMQRMQLGLNPISSLSSFDSRKDLAVQYLTDKNFYKNVSDKERSEIDAIISEGMGITLQESQKKEGQFAAFSDITQQLGQIYFGQLLYDQMSAYEKSKFVYENSQKINSMSLESQEVGLAQQRVALSSAVSSFSESSSLNDFHKKLIDYKKSVLSKWVEEAGSDNPNAWLYASLLMKSNFDMTEFMSPSDVGIKYGKDVTDILSSFFPKFSFTKKATKKIK